MRSSTSLCRSSTRSCTRESTAVRSRSGPGRPQPLRGAGAFAARATSSGVDSGIAAIGPPVNGACDVNVPRRGEETDAAQQRRTSSGSSTYVASGSVSGSWSSMCPGSCAIPARVRAATARSRACPPACRAHTPSVSRTSACSRPTTAARPSAADGPRARRRPSSRTRRWCGARQRVADRGDAAGGHRQAGDAEPDEHQRQQRVATRTRRRRRPACAPWCRRAAAVAPGRAPPAATGPAGRPARRASGRWPSRTAPGRWCRCETKSTSSMICRRAQRGGRHLDHHPDRWAGRRRGPAPANAARLVRRSATIGAITHGVVAGLGLRLGERLELGRPAAAGCVRPSR